MRRVCFSMFLFKERLPTCKELSVKHVHSFILPWVLTLEVDGVQCVFNEGGENHGHQDGILKGIRIKENEKVIKKAEQRRVIPKQVLTTSHGAK